MLRNGVPPKKTPGKTPQVIAGLDAALSRGNAPEDLTVHRGVRGDYAEKVLEAARNGGTLADRAYLSTTLAAYQAWEFSARKGTTNVIIEIHVPKGSPGAFTDALDITGEAEWLMPRNTPVKFTSAKQDTDGRWHVTAEVARPGMHLSTTFTLSTEDSGDAPPATDEPDAVVDEVLSSVRRLSRSARAALLADLAKAPHEAALRIAQRWAERWHGELAELLTESQVRAVLQGMQSIARQIEPARRADRQAQEEELSRGLWSDKNPPPPMLVEAVKSLRDKQVVLPEDMGNLSAVARQKAFTVAGAETTAVVEKVKTALVKAVQTGGTLKTFRQDLDETLEGGTFLSPARSETVFRNAVMGAYSDGQERLLDNPAVGELFPYRAYWSTADDRRRPEHAAMETAGIQNTNIFPL